MAHPAPLAASASARTIAQNTNEESSWKYLVGQFLKLSADELAPLEITFVNDELSITGLTQEQVTRLQEILRSPEAVKSNIGYTLQPIIGGRVAPLLPLQAIRYPEAIVPKENIALEVYQHLFSHAFLRRCGSLEWQESSRLMLEAKIDSDMKNLSVQQILLLRKKLGSVNFFQLRKAFAARESEPLPDLATAAMPQDSAITRHLDKIIYLREIPDGHATAYFDLGLLLQCVTAPALEVSVAPSAAAQERYRITLSKNHLLAYLTTIFGEFVLHTPASATAQAAEAEQKSEPVQAVPLFLNIQPGVRRKIVYAFLLDISDSMRLPNEESFAAYIQRAKELINNIYLRTAEDTQTQDQVRLSLFGTQVSPTEVFNLSEIARINAYLDNIRVSVQRGQNTRLKASIQEKLHELSTLENIGQCNVIFCVMTDGVDNQSTAEEIARLTSDLERLRTQANRPQIIPVGIGPECDIDVLDNLAELAAGEGMQAINLAGEDNFDSIYGDVSAMQNARRVFCIVDGQGSFEVHAREGSVAHHETARVQVPGRFVVDGQEFLATQGGQRVLELAPLATAAPAGVAQQLQLFRTRGRQEQHEHKDDRHRSSSAHTRGFTG